MSIVVVLPSVPDSAAVSHTSFSIPILILAVVEERDSVVYEQRMEQNGIQEQKDVRFRVMEEFLNLRGRNEVDPHRWAVILEDDFSLRLPRTDIPGVVCSSGGDTSPAVNNDTNGSGPNMCYPLGTAKKVLTGLKDVMEDSNRVATLLHSLTGGSSDLSISYQCHRGSFLMDGATAVLRWTAISAGAMTKGATSEFSIEGMVNVTFNPLSNKLVSMEFMF